MNILRKPFRYTNFHAVFWLIGINLLIFAAMQFFGNIVVGSVDISNLGIRDNLGRQFTRLEMTLSNVLAMMPQAVVKNGALWSFVTYMFVHADFGHVFFNMFGLFIFGFHIERQMGSKEFLLFYLVTGALAGVFSFVIYILTHNPMVFLMGASGALYAVQLAFAIYNPRAIVYILGIIPVRAPWMVLGFTVLSMYFVFTGRGGNVAHLTHLAGFGFCWLYFMVRFGVNPWRRLTGR